MSDVQAAGHEEDAGIDVTAATDDDHDGRGCIERRRGIVQVARAHFCEHGFALTSMSSIARDVGGSKSTLWSYFDSKESLLAAVLHDMLGEAGAQIELEMPLGEDPSIVLQNFARRFLGVVLKPDMLAIFRLMIAEADRLPTHLSKYQHYGPERTVRYLSRYLTALGAQGRIDMGDPDQAANFFMALCKSWRGKALLDPGRANTMPTPDEIADMVAMFLRSYAVRPASR